MQREGTICTSLGVTPIATLSSLAVVVMSDDMRGSPNKRPISRLTSDTNSGLRTCAHGLWTGERGELCGDTHR